MQELLGHKDVSTTMIYTHVLNRGGKADQQLAGVRGKHAEVFEDSNVGGCRGMVRFINHDQKETVRVKAL